MFYRRKLVFALLENLGGVLEKTRLQKLVFLMTQKQKKPNYEFVPYKYGCYSYSLNADLDAMVKRKWLKISDFGYERDIEKKYYSELLKKDQIFIDETVKLYGNMNTEQVTKHTYLNFPYHAINSTIAEKLLPQKYFEKVQASRPSSQSTILFTIGYEGISLEQYLNRLIKNDVKVLVDVRRNPLSQKYGFSKKLLTNFCEKLGIKYIHIPEVGIDSSKRIELNNQSDYDILFEDYKKTVLKETLNSQEKILNLLEKHQRIALTCFESDICQCHRKHLAEKIKKSPTFRYELKHI